MTALIVGEGYDCLGREVFRPDYAEKFGRPTYPIGRYVSQPLSVHCKSLQDIYRFLRGCHQISDEDLFQKKDYWQPPDEFEKMRKGDCDCFAFWTWRQVLAMGLNARIVFGTLGSRPSGHAWVTYTEGGNSFLIDPTRCILGDRMPRLATYFYVPRYSVSWDGSKLRYYHHKEQNEKLSLLKFVWLTPEWLLLWGRFWVVGIFFCLPRNLIRKLFRKLARKAHRPTPAE